MSKLKTGAIIVTEPIRVNDEFWHEDELDFLHAGFGNYAKMQITPRYQPSN